MWHRHLSIFVILASAVLVHADVEEKDSQRSGKGIIRNDQDFSVF